MYIAILGRQPALGIAELERLYGDVRWFSNDSAVIQSDSADLSRLGGTQKLGRVVAELPRSDWLGASRKITTAYQEAWRTHEGKITLGLSAYGFDVSVRDIQKTGLILKKKLRESGVSLRLIPNDSSALSTATSHHNKLGLSDNKVELLVVRGSNGRIIVAESVGSQNITAYAKRDQGRPKRDAFVGMLPPKLAQIIVNLASYPESLDHPSDDAAGKALGPAASPVLLDPFCGTGVILQEAALMGYSVYGTDLAPKMIDYSEQNLAWLKQTHRTDVTSRLEQGDAMDHIWRQPIDAVACETYLGQPFSAPPSPAKLREVRGNCNHIISEFLKNVAGQLRSGTAVCIAVPAWRGGNGQFTHLPLVNQLGSFGFEQWQSANVSPDQLLYYREDQVVARQLLVMVKK